VPSYLLLCIVLGVVFGWLPAYFHGPIPYKYSILGMRGETAVWGWYTARMLIGLVVGITVWPSPWYVRGPLCGFLTLLPLSIVSLATPGCGSPCMFWNEVTATVVGLAVAGVAFALTRRHHL
jgi:hypothetical protein